MPVRVLEEVQRVRPPQEHTRCKVTFFKSKIPTVFLNIYVCIYNFLFMCLFAFGCAGSAAARPLLWLQQVGLPPVAGRGFVGGGLSRGRV